MLEHSTRRRLVALLALAAATNAAGYLAAQPPATSTTNRTPKLLSNCDVTAQSCGGDPTFYGSGTSGGYAPPSSPKPECTAGTPQQCRQDTTRACVEWVVVSGSGGANASGGLTGWSLGGSGSATKVCGSYVVSVRTWYWSKG